MFDSPNVRSYMLLDYDISLWCFYFFGYWVEEEGCFVGSGYFFYFYVKILGRFLIAISLIF